MDKAISAIIIEKMDSSAALYSELVIVNPIIPSGCLELFAVVAIIEFTTCFHEFLDRNLSFLSPIDAFVTSEPLKYLYFMNIF